MGLVASAPCEAASFGAPPIRSPIWPVNWKRIGLVARPDLTASGAPFGARSSLGLAKHFNRLEDGSYVGDAGGSPIWFRCVEYHDDHFVHVDGGGRRFRYRLLPIEEDGTIRLPEGEVLYPKWWPNRPEGWGVLHESARRRHRRP